MTGADLAQALSRLELSQRQFAALIGANPRTVRSWINGATGDGRKIVVPRHVEVLVHVLEAYSVDLVSIPGFDY